MLKKRFKRRICKLIEAEGGYPLAMDACPLSCESCSEPPSFTPSTNPSLNPSTSSIPLMSFTPTKDNCVGNQACTNGPNFVGPGSCIGKEVCCSAQETTVDSDSFYNITSGK